MIGYIDPGSGSFFFQMLIGGLVGAAVAIKAFWSRITGFFRRGSKEEPGTEPAETLD